MESSLENRLNSLVRNSGNSDVDLLLNIEIETKAIAYGFLCGLYAKGEISEYELEKGIRKLDSLIDRDKKRKTLNNNKTSHSRPTIFDFPSQNQRRKWI